MKILGKDVYIGKKLICTEFTYEIDDFETLSSHEKSHKGVLLEENVLFIQDKDGHFVDVLDTEHIGSLALKFYGAAPRCNTHPINAGQKYIEIKPYFNDQQQKMTFDLKHLISVANSLKYESNLENSI